MLVHPGATITNLTAIAVDCVLTYEFRRKIVEVMYINYDVIPGGIMIFFHVEYVHRYILRYYKWNLFFINFKDVQESTKDSFVFTYIFFYLTALYYQYL